MPTDDDCSADDEHDDRTDVDILRSDLDLLHHFVNVLYLKLNGAPDIHYDRRSVHDAAELVREQWGVRSR